MKDTGIKKFDSTEWSGNGELWLDPAGNDVSLYPCTMRISANNISYAWDHEGELKEGRIELSDPESTWTDSWHQRDTVTCSNVKNPRSLFTIEYSYAGGSGEHWGWRINMSSRPDESIVLQMTNIAPWGEEGRAVRMVFLRTS